MSILKVSSTTKVIDGIVKAKKSEPFVIFKKNFLSGDIKIPVTPDEKILGLNLIVFYALDAAGSQPSSCGGEEQMVSDPKGKFYKTCSASSELGNGFQKCEHGLAGKMEDSPFAMWASDGEGLSAWMKVEFKAPVQITKIEYRSRAAANERNKRITVKFDDGQKFQTVLRNTDAIQPLNVEPVATESLKFTIDEVYSSNNNGGAFNIYGIPCFVESGVETLDPASQISLECKDTFSKNEQIIKRTFKDGDKFRAFCPKTCIEEKDSLDIYGSSRYSSDSPICLAAFHSGCLSKDGGPLNIKVMKGIVEYEAENKNGFSSQTKIGSPT